MHVRWHRISCIFCCRLYVRVAEYVCVFMFLYPFILSFLITSRITHTYVSYFRLIFHFGWFQFSFHLIQFCCWFRLWSIWDFNWGTHWWSMMIHDDDDLQMIIELYHLQAKLLFSFSDEILFQRHRVPKLNEKKNTYCGWSSTYWNIERILMTTSLEWNASSVIKEKIYGIKNE